MPRNGNGNGTAIATYRAPQIAEALQQPAALEQIRKALPAGMADKVAERFAQVAIRYADDDEIAKCTPQSVVRAVVEAASCGVEVGGPRKHAYLVRYGDEATLQFGYGGLIYQGVRDGAIRHGRAHAVYEGDEFYVEEGSNPQIVHRPNLDVPRTPDRARYFYAILTLPNGEKVPAWMTRAQVERVRQRSKTKDSPAWRYSYDEMGKKVALKRAFKYLPMGDDLRGSALAQMLERDNRAEFGELGDVDEEAQQAEANEQAGTATRAKLDEIRERISTKQQARAQPMPGGQDLGEQSGEPPAADDGDLPPTKKQMDRLDYLIRHRSFHGGDGQALADEFEAARSFGNMTAIAADEWAEKLVEVIATYVGNGERASQPQVRKMYAQFKELGELVPRQAKADLLAEIHAGRLTKNRASAAINEMERRAAAAAAEQESENDDPYNWEDA